MPKIIAASADKCWFSNGFILEKLIYPALAAIKNKSRDKADTKFTHIFTSSQYKEQMLRSGYLYQLYAYLRTQEAATLGQGWRSEGMLLHPHCGEVVDAYVDMQGHRLRFKTIDLMGSAEEFERQLLALGHGWAENMTDRVVSSHV